MALGASTATADSLRIYCRGVDPARLADAVTRVDRPDASFDAVLVAAGTALEEGFRWLVDSASPLAAVIAIGDCEHQRVDAVLADNPTLFLGETGGLVERLRDASRGLAAIPVGGAREGAVALGLMATRDGEMRPRISADWRQVMTYEALSGVADSRALLRCLARHQLCQPRFAERLPVCPVCSGSRLIAREVCPHCGSANIAEHALVHHFRCGYQAPRSDFLQGEGLYCPKCRRELRHFGVDYDTPGAVTTCGRCEADSAAPQVALLCLDCGGETRSDQVRWLDWHAYHLTPAGEAAIRSGHLPGGVIEGAAGEPEGRSSPHDLRRLIELCQGLAQGRGRPYAVLALGLCRDSAAAHARTGARAQWQARVQGLIADVVDPTDGVAVLDDRVVICLPETDERRCERVMRQLDARLRQALKGPAPMRLERLGAASIEAIKTRLAAP